MKGGARRGAGRKPGQINRISAEARERAAATGELPHEFLLRISRGEDIDGYTPSFVERFRAAEVCASYFAPKLASVEQKTEIELPALCSEKAMTPEEWEKTFGKP